jgi:hypothetical protein
VSAAEWGERRGAGEDDAPIAGAERTVAVWLPAMSDATYGRLLRLLFDPLPDEGGAPDEGEAA